MLPGAGVRGVLYTMGFLHDDVDEREKKKNVNEVELRSGMWKEVVRASELVCDDFSGGTRDCCPRVAAAGTPFKGSGLVSVVRLGG